MAATYTTNLSLKKPAYGDTADIAVINDNMDDLDEYCHDTRFMVASAYSDQGTTYAVGDLVIYLGNVYKCTGATSGTWDSSKWTQTTIGDELEDVSGGTEVEANPSGTATATLQKLKVDTTIYEVGIDYLTVQNGVVCAVYEE